MYAYMSVAFKRLQDLGGVNQFRSAWLRMWTPQGDHSLGVSKNEIFSREKSLFQWKMVGNDVIMIKSKIRKRCFYIKRVEGCWYGQGCSTNHLIGYNYIGIALSSLFHRTSIGNGSHHRRQKCVQDRSLVRKKLMRYFDILPRYS